MALAEKNFRVLTLGLLVTVAFVMSMGCTPKSESDSRVTMRLPNLPSNEQVSSKATDVSAFATVDNLRVIIINVSGEGISSPIYAKWERHSTGETPPLSFDLDIPRGTNRLAQVLLAFETNGAIIIYYGDKTSDIDANTTSLPITVSRMGTEALGSGAIAGRFLRLDGTGPTGRVLFQYSPDSRPPMIVSRGWMINGWFEFFALKGASFSYTMEHNSESIFSKISVDSSALLGTLNPEKRLRVSVPTYWTYNSWSNGTAIGERTQRLGRQSVLGFFGPGSTGKTVCYNTTAVDMTNLYIDSVSSSLLKWDPHSGVSTNILVDSTDGVRGGTTTCSGTLYADLLKINPLAVPREGSDALGFRGPFKLLSDANSGAGTDKRPVLATLNGSDLTLTWELLPGLAGSERGVAGIGVFTRSGYSSDTNGDADYREDEGIACNRLESLGFTLAADVPATAATSSVTVRGIDSTAYNSGKFQAILCPYLTNPVNSNEKYIGAAGEFRAYGSTSSGGGGGSVNGVSKVLVGLPGQTWDSISHAFTGTPIEQFEGQPFSLQLAALDSSGNLLTGYAGSSTSFGLSSSAGGLVLPSGEAIWNSDGTGGIIIRFDSNGSEIWLKTSGGADGVVLSESRHFPILPKPAQYNLLSTSSFGNGTCQPMMAMLSGVSATGGASDATAAFAPAAGLSLTLSAGAGINFSAYSDATCTAALGSSFPISAGDSSAMIYLQFSGTGTGTPTLSGTLAPSTDTFSIGGTPTSASNLRVISSGSFSRGACQPLFVMVTDGSGSAVGVSSLSGTLSVDLGQLYTTSNCSDAAPQMNQAFGLSVSQPAVVFYYKAMTPGTVNFTATDAGTACTGPVACATGSTTATVR